MRLEELFRYRSGWMGFAILWIMFFHCGASIENPVLRIFKQLGYGGVDLFVFASGIGCQYSLDKNSEPLAFLRRRAERLLPTWWIFLFVWWMLRDQQGLELPPQSLLGNFFCIQAFVDWHFCFNWYISALPVLYFLAPYFHSLINRNVSPKRFLIAEFGLLALTAAFINNDYLVLMTRLPIFFAGFYCAAIAKRGALFTRAAAIGLFGATVLGASVLIFCLRTYPELTLSIYGVWWYPFLLITPGFCFGFSLLLNRLPLINKLLFAIGGLSFEIYLVHILLFNIILHSTLQLQNWHWFALLPIVLIGSLALRGMKNFVVKGFCR